MTKLTIAIAALLALSGIARAEMSPLRSAVIEYYSKGRSVQHAIAFDICAVPFNPFNHSERARNEWLGPKRRVAYDRVGAALLVAYRASEGTDGALEQVDADFCKAIGYPRQD